MVPEYKGRLSLPAGSIRRILSSLLFSGVLSIPGRAAATRRKSCRRYMTDMPMIKLASHPLQTKRARNWFAVDKRERRW